MTDPRYWFAQRLLEQGARGVVTFAGHGDPNNLEPIARQVLDRLAFVASGAPTGTPTRKRQPAPPEPKYRREVKRPLRILRALAEHGPLTTTEVAERVGISRQNAKVVTHDMRKRGELRSTPTGPLHRGTPRVVWHIAAQADEGAA